ncbi:CTP1-Mitochondrial citrate transporter-member of the mitochondrial carrier (MCF) family [Fusarium albosuccineum]|uniref:CTP1-Mitochondrial citrate transporter-member of the mitochondrial carrier (MCF) family n=1 Tax=Fusarium albosuccineum TaxID=1237068 RepID=A0A8H4LMP6_9HYPO|nr:CTP1-Mitochondrial citrate transporter-member of the mitochondrial carrier (MCF) family [Fusarium albosuccineum]
MATVAKSGMVSTQIVQQQTSPTTKTQKQLVTPGVSLAAGAVAGGIEATITYPFEFAKTLAQLSARQATGSTTKVSRSPFAVISQTVRNGGFGAIYTGCSSLIAVTGVRFLSFDAIKNQLVDSNGKLSPGYAILAGMIAGAVESVTVVTPTERIKTALIDDATSGNRRLNNGFHALRVTIAERGIREVYRGLLSTTVKQSATSGVRMGSYNILKDLVPSDKKGSVVTFGIGATAGVITVYATQPFDTIKTRTQGAKGATTVEAFQQVLRDGGIRGFWSGSSMRLGRLILSGGIVFTAYENVASLLMGLKK